MNMKKFSQIDILKYKNFFAEDGYYAVFMYDKELDQKLKNLGFHTFNIKNSKFKHFLKRQGFHNFEQLIHTPILIASSEKINLFTQLKKFKLLTFLLGAIIDGSYYTKEEMLKNKALSSNDFFLKLYLSYNKFKFKFLMFYITHYKLISVLNALLLRRM